jgi:hypothetical protein
VAEAHPSAGEALAPGAGRIAVHVREPDQLFNSMDPSPFHQRELDREAEEFIMSSAKELRGEAPIALLVYLDQRGALGDESHTIGDAIRAHFARRAHESRHELRQLLRRGRTSLAIGLAFLTASLVGGDMVARFMGERPSPLSGAGPRRVARRARPAACE